MKVLFLSYWVRHHQECWEPALLSGSLEKVFGEPVHPVYLCHNALDQEYPGKSRALTGAEHFIHRPHWGSDPDDVVDLVEKERPDHICVWNGEMDVYRDVVDALRAWFDIPITFWEMGWFPQKKHIWHDPEGVNGGSFLARSTLEELQHCSKDFTLLEQKKRWYYEQVRRDSPATALGRPYILIPLQLEDDTNIIRYSPMKTMAEFIAWVCAAFEKDSNRYTLVFRPHPLDPHGHAYRSIDLPNSIVTSEGTIYDWMAHAEGVVGINSTVLIEALMYNKKVWAVGQSVLSNKGVALEGLHPPGECPFHSFEPTQERLDHFLALLAACEISICC